MQITFIRTSERDYAIRCTCDDGAVLAVRPYDRPLGLPHDISPIMWWSVHWGWRGASGA